MYCSNEVFMEKEADKKRKKYKQAWKGILKRETEKKERVLINWTELFSSEIGSRQYRVYFLMKHFKPKNISVIKNNRRKKGKREAMLPPLKLDLVFSRTCHCLLLV